VYLNEDDGQGWNQGKTTQTQCPSYFSTTPTPKKVKRTPRHRKNESQC
jgi:hypothetical protein